LIMMTSGLIPSIRPYSEMACGSKMKTVPLVDVTSKNDWPCQATVSLPGGAGCLASGFLASCCLSPCFLASCEKAHGTARMHAAAPDPAAAFPLHERDQRMAGKNVVEFTSANWATEVEKSSTPVVVDFWAPWCGPCRQLGPTIDKLAEQFAGKVKVGKLNVDDAPDVATKFGVTSIPRVFIFKGGDKPQKTFVGLTSERELVASINSVLEG